MGKKGDLRNHMILKITCLHRNQITWKNEKNFNPVQILCAAEHLHDIYAQDFIFEKKDSSFLLSF